MGISNQGIYGILNSVTNKIYIGNTNNFSNRKNNHFSHLRRNNHVNIHLQNSWNKYKEIDFLFIILENNIEKNKLIERELYWIRLKNSLNRNYGYNLAIPGEDSFKHSKESIKKMIKVKTNASIPEKYKIYQIDKITGEFIKEFASTGIAAKELGYPNGKKIQRVLQGGVPSYKGFVYVYKKNYNKNKNYKIIKNRQYKLRIKPLFQYDKEMNFIKEWKSIDEVIKVLTGSKSSLYSSISRKQTYKGFYWKRN